MSHIKTYKVLVDSVAVFDTDNLDVSVHVFFMSRM